jgi:pilus assembly protein CpaB
MRAKSVAMLMLALGCGLVASIGITQVMAKRKDVPQGEHLSAEVLKLENWPKDKVPLGAISKIEDIDTCRTRTKLYAGEPILDKKLFGKGTGSQSDTILIPKGYRAVPVKVDNVSGGPGLIMPSDRVDVLVHLVRNTNLGIPQTTTRTVLQNIKVFAVNDVVDVEKDKDSNTKDKPKAVQQTISLLVTPAQGAMLTLASEMGKIRLIMRSSEDDTIANDGQAGPDDLLGNPQQKGDRGKEKLYVDDTPAPLKTGSKLTDFLKSMNRLASKAKAVVPGMATETFSMRILQPNGINDVVLEADGGPHAARMPTWHVASSCMTSVNGGGSNPGNTSSVATRSVPTPPAPNPNGTADTQPADSPADKPASDPIDTPNNKPADKPADTTPHADPAPSSTGESNAMIED